jgi:hypothetical protein
MTIGAAWAEGSWVDASWVVGAWEPVTATKTIGGTSQLDAFSSTGGLDVTGTKTIGGVSQLEVLSSTGGIDVTGTQTLGGISQLEALSSSGFIQVGTLSIPAPGERTLIVQPQNRTWPTF